MPTAGCARQCTIGGVVPVSSRVRRNKQVTEMPTSEKAWRITLLEDCFSSSARSGNLAIGCKAPVYLVAAKARRGNHRASLSTTRVRRGGETFSTSSLHIKRWYALLAVYWSRWYTLSSTSSSVSSCPVTETVSSATQSQKHRSFEAGNLTTSESLSSDRSYRSSGHAELDINHLTIAPIISSTRSLS